MKHSSVVALNMQRIIQTSGIKKYVLAQRAGIGYRKLSAMLNGRQMIKADDIVSIAKALGVTPNDLYVTDLAESGDP